MPRQILVVEDNDFMRKFIGAALAGDERAVTTVASIDEANAFLAGIADASDLFLVIDIFLDHESGIEFGEATAKKFTKVHILLISAFTDHVLMLDPEITSRMAFLRKPFTAEELKTAITELGG
jgi:two-component SAPR family response regulator